MKRYLLLLSSAWIGLNVSCTKQTVTTTKNTITGTWKTTQWASDDNKNDILDASELKADSDTRFTFNSDGTGTSWNGIHGSGDQDFTWTLNDKDLYLTLHGSFVTIIDTYRVDNIAQSDLTLAVRIHNTTALWWVFKKQ